MQKPSLLPDDVLLFIRNQTLSISALMPCLRNFGKVSGYKVNEGKSETMMIRGDWPKQLDNETKFRWPKKGILTTNSSQLCKANYVKLIRNDLEKWEMLPLSLVGRVETIGMNVLPRMLFFCSSLPITVPASTFKFLNRLIPKFI